MKADLNQLMSLNQVKARAGRKFSDRGIQPYPGILPTSNEWISFMRSLRDKLPVVYESSEWSRLSTICGSFPNPAGTPNPRAMDQRKQLIPKHVRLEPSPKQVALLEEAVRIYYNVGDPGSIKLKRGANNGLPDLTSDDAFKRRYVAEWLAHGDDIVGKMDRRDYSGLFNDYGHVNAIVNGYRLQPDTSTIVDGVVYPKERLVHTYKGRIVPMDKRSPLPDFATSRSRAIAMAPQSMFFPLRLKAALHDDYCYTEFKAFKNFNAIDQMREIADYKHVGLYDVTNHDSIMPPVFKDLAVKRAHELFRPWLASLYEDSLRGGLLAFSDIAGEAGVNLFGSPFDPASDPTRLGNPSGHPETSRFATWITVGYIWLAICKYCEERGLQRPDLASVLRRETDLYVHISGDNVALATSSDMWKDLVHKLEEISDVGWFEQTPTFLGWEVGPGWYYPSLPGYVVNITAGVERDYRSKSRKFWSFGYLSRKDHYMLHPAFEAVDATLQSAFSSAFGVTMDDFARSYFKDPGDEFDSMSAELAANPDLIHARPGIDELIKTEALALHYWVLLPEDLTRVYALLR